MQNTTLTYKKPLKTTDKKYHKLIFQREKSQNGLVTKPFSLWRRHALTVADGAFNHKINYITIC